MRIENKEYIILRIENLIYYYVIKDNEINNILENKKIIDKIYNKFIEFLESKYKVKIENIDNFKEDIILYEIDKNLMEIIENNIY